MDPKAVTIANARYRTAGAALRRLENASSFDEYSDDWFVFITAWKSALTALEQGSKTSPQSRQWWGGVKEKRKSEALLQFLFQARNEEEHGLTKSISNASHTGLYKVTGGQRILTPGPGRPYPLDVGTGQPLELVNQHFGPALGTIKDKFGKEYGPPIAYEGEHLPDMSPVGVGRVGLSWVRLLIDDAAKRATSQ